MHVVNHNVCHSIATKNTLTYKKLTEYKENDTVMLQNVLDSTSKVASPPPSCETTLAKVSCMPG
jgi:hypothetical protein